MEHIVYIPNAPAVPLHPAHGARLQGRVKIRHPAVKGDPAAGIHDGDFCVIDIVQIVVQLQHPMIQLDLVHGRFRSPAQGGAHIIVRLLFDAALEQ